MNSQFPSIEQEDGQLTNQGVGKHKKRGFEVYGLSPQVLSAVKRIGFKIPTRVQKKTIPVALLGRDVVAMARTGSGKTAAFLIPMIERLKAHSSLLGARGIVISPTRELAQQTHLVCSKLSISTSLKICMLQGGDRIEAQFEALQNFPDVIICTPGRMAHLLLEMEKELNLTRVEVLIFDEADRLFEMGFQPQVELILSKCPSNRQTMLFSATLPKQLVEFAQAGLNSPEIIRLNADSQLSESLKQAFFKVRTDEKIPALLHLLEDIIPADQSTVVFVSTKHHVEYLQRVLLLCSDIKCSVAYGALDQESRAENLENFRNGITKVLLVTDLAARGIDIPSLNNVVNFDFPANKTLKLFVHRVGRACRQGRPGCSISFVVNDELPFLVEVCLFIGIPLFSSSKTSDSAENKHYLLDTMTTKDIDLGVFPQDLLDGWREKIDRVAKEDADLVALERSVFNAYNLYKRSRENASRSSVKRAKQLNITKLHPFFVDPNAKDTSALTSLATQLKNFKPKETIFEVNDKKLKNSDTTQSAAIKAIKKKFLSMQHIQEKTDEMLNKKGNSEKKEDLDEQESTSAKLKKLNTMQENGNESSKQQPKNKRKAPLSKAERKRLKKGGVSVDEIISARVSKAKEVKTDFKETGFVSIEADETMDAFRNDAVSLQKEALDMMPDDQKAMLAKQKSYKWDRKKKKFIKASEEEHAKMKRVRNESGQVISSKKRGELFNKWQKNKRGMKSKAIEDQDDQDDSTSVKKISYGLRKRKQEKQSGGKSNFIRDEQQLRKKLRDEDRVKERNQKGFGKMMRQKKEKDKRQEAEKKFSGNSKKMPKPSRNRNARSRIVG